MAFGFWKGKMPRESSVVKRGFKAVKNMTTRRLSKSEVADGLQDCKSELNNEVMVAFWDRNQTLVYGLKAAEATIEAIQWKIDQRAQGTFESDCGERFCSHCGDLKLIELYDELLKAHDWQNRFVAQMGYTELPAWL
jgi:hypothetical protein